MGDLFKEKERSVEIIGADLATRHGSILVRRGGLIAHVNFRRFVACPSSYCLVECLHSGGTLGSARQPTLASRAKPGAGGGTRTHTTLPSRDFKSLASTNSATSAFVARSDT